MILVTGGAGFIGSNMVAALTERGAAAIVCDRVAPGGAKARNLAKHPPALLADPADLADILTRHRAAIDAVVHLGAVTSTTETNIDLTMATNYHLSAALWDWCSLAGKRLIYASSAATYGDGSAGFDDDATPAALAQLRPRNLYGWSKHRFDRHVAAEIAGGRRMPRQWVGLKFFNVYGPNEYHKGAMQSVIARSFAAVRAGAPLQLFRSYREGWQDGGQQRDFIHVDDCVDAMLWLLDHPAVNGLFNLGTGQARSWRDLGHALFGALGRPPEIAYVDMPEALRPKYQYFTQAAMQRLRGAGYSRPFTTLEDGVADYVGRFLSRDDPYR